MIVDKYIQEKALFRGKKATGLTMQFCPEGTCLYSAMAVNREKDSFVKTALTGVTSELDAVCATMPTDVPVCLSITGTKIMNREQVIDGDIADADLLDTIFANASIKDFYLQRDLIEGTHYLVSIIRKDILDAILNDFASRKYNIVGVDFGLGAFVAVRGLLPKSDEYVCGNFVVKVEDDVVVSCLKQAGQSQPVEYRLGADSISSDELTAYAQCVFFLSGVAYNEPPPPVAEARETFLYKSFVGKAVAFIVITMLGLLLVNFFLFDKYYKRHYELESVLNQNKDLLVRLDTLKNELKTKTELFEKAGFSGGSRLSYYCDRLAASMPGSIVLDEVNCLPVDKKMKDKQEVLIKNRSIMVTGTVTSSTELNQWIIDIGKESWVKSVNILGYFQDDNFSRATFQINIKIMKEE